MSNHNFKLLRFHKNNFSKRPLKKHFLCGFKDFVADIISNIFINNTVYFLTTRQRLSIGV